MNILIDIGHPAHIHIFRYFAKEMGTRGHSVMFTCRDKEVVIDLLEHYEFTYYSFGKSLVGVFGKLAGLFKFDIMLLRIALKFKPDIFLSHGSFYAAHVAGLLRKPHISLEDTGNMEQVRLYRPFTRIIITRMTRTKDTTNTG